MTQISYKSLDDHLGEARFSPVYLVYGEEFLCKSVFEKLLDAMVGPDRREFSYESMEGTDENVVAAIESLNTFSLLADTKVVALCDARIFYSKQDNARIVDRIKTAYQDGDIQKAVRHFLKLLAVLNLSPEDVDEAAREKILGLESKDSDHSWLDPLLIVCRKDNLVLPPDRGAGELLASAIEKGFAGGNHLIVTTDVVDKRSRLFAILKTTGTIIDCSVPRGDRKADRKAQEAVLLDQLQKVLVRYGKTIDKSAFFSLCDMTGFDLRTFIHNIEKLVHYVGDRKKITEEDVTHVLKRSKSDPLYELTNAVADRNAGDALFFLNSLLSKEIHPLQALAAVTNQIRKLMVIKEFVESPIGTAWHAGCPYPHFTDHVVHAVQEFDKSLLNEIERREEAFRAGQSVAGDPHGQSSAAGKRKIDTDLLAASQPQNPFPLYQTLKKSENFKKAELVDFFRVLAETDMRLKSTGQNPRLVLEQTILRICRRSGE